MTRKKRKKRKRQTQPGKQCPFCRSRSTMEYSTGFYYCYDCKREFDDDPNEGGDYGNDPWEQFAEAVQAAECEPRMCTTDHWQIRKGKRLVNVWPNTKKGFRYQLDGESSRLGDVAAAIRLAVGRRPTEFPPWEPVSPTEPVGLMRRFWHWLW